MADLSQVPLAELEAELQRRRGSERCGCGKWGTYLGAYDSDGYTRRCHGCLRATGRCTCR
jgi:hypothetical protein